MNNEVKKEFDILAVDDTVTQLKTIVAILSDNGYSVRPAISGALALAAVQNKKPDLILLDITMPGMSGYEVCKRLKAGEETKEIPIIFLSAMDDVENKLKAFKFGGVDYITKPYQAEEVLARIHTHLSICAMQKKITEKNQELEETLSILKRTKSKLMLSEKMASLGILMAGIAHEINNPINFISGGIDSLKINFLEIKEILTIINKFESNKDNSEFTQKIINTKERFDFETIEKEIDLLFTSIKNGTRRASEIIRGMLLFARTNDSDFEEYDIHAGLDSSLLMLQNKLKNRIEIVKSYGEIPPVVCNLGQINQVLLNILTNAVHAIQGKGKIYINTIFENNNLTIKIKDTGKGMNDDEKEKIFVPFYTTKAVGEGTGLGLSISYSIIKNHEGSIHIESEPEKGSTFIINLPIKKLQ